jgi:hypothetical protein
MEVRKGLAEYGSGEATIHKHPIRHTCAQRFQSVYRHAIETVQPVMPWRQQLVRKVAVKQNLCPTEALQERHGMWHDVAKDDIKAVAIQRHGAGEIRHARNGARCTQTLTHMAREEVTVDTHVKGTIAGFFETAGTVVVGSKNGDAVAYGLQMQRRVHHEAFGTPESQVRVKKPDVQKPSVGHHAANTDCATSLHPSAQRWHDNALTLHRSWCSNGLSFGKPWKRV